MKQQHVQPVRVLFLDHVPRMSGAEQSLADLVAGLSEGPVEPVVVLPSDGPLAAALRARGVLVRMVPMSQRLLETSRATLTRHPLVAVARLFAFVTAAFRVWRIIREVRPRIVHTNTLKSHLIALLPAKAARVPIVWHLRDILPKGWLQYAFLACANLADAIIVPSRAVAEPFRGRRRLLRRVRLIPNGIRVRDFQDAAADRSLREMMGVAASDPVVGIVGRIAPWKGQDVFLRAAAMVAQRHPRAHFAIAGAALFPEKDEPFEQHLFRLAAELGIEDRVTFLGWQPAPEAMSAIDVFVHASAEPEPFGRAIVEAMAAGKPVIAAAGGAVQEIVPPAAGFIVTPSRPDLLADAMDRLLSDRKLRRRMGEAGAAVAENFFPVERTVQSVAQVYRALVQRTARRAMRRRAPAAPRPQKHHAQPRPSVAARAAVRLDGPPRSYVPERYPDGHEPGRGSQPRAPQYPPAPPVPSYDPARRSLAADRARPAARATLLDSPAPSSRAVAVARGATATLSLPALDEFVPAPAPTPRPRVVPADVSRRHPMYDAVKRAIDLTLALAIAVVGSPLWAFAAVMIKLESRGPVLFRGTVYGRNCRPFTYYKFRSMRIDSDDRAHRKFIERYVRENGGHEVDGEVVYKLLGDDRVTGVGAWLRKFSIDEIPQIINVIRGEMSFVGPRPPLDYEFDLYDNYAKSRMAVLPGITGLQQVWSRDMCSFEKKLDMDMAYIERRSIWVDVKLIAHTILAIPRGH
ncbi:MAG: sugar transferase [Actinomycetota bacterium]